MFIRRATYLFRLACGKRCDSLISHSLFSTATSADSTFKALNGPFIYCGIRGFLEGYSLDDISGILFDSRFRARSVLRRWKILLFSHLTIVIGWNETKY